MLGAGVETKARLESWFGGWIFETLDVRGGPRGLAIGWNARNVMALNVWGMESVLGMTFKSLVLTLRMYPGCKGNSKNHFRKKLAFLSREGSLKYRFNKVRYKSTLENYIYG